MYNKYLETFILIVEEGSFTKASEKLYLSPTAIMKQINSLENDLNIKLFTRTHQGSELTESGKIIYDAAKKIIDYSSKEIDRAKLLEGKENHTIVIGTSIVCPCKPLIDIWYKISNNYPEYKIKIVPFEEDHTQTLTTLKSKNTDFDFIVTPCDSASWLKEVNFLKLGETRICINVPQNHHLANRNIISLKDLNNENVMISQKGDSKTINKLRNDILNNCKNVNIIDTPFIYDINVFNKCIDEYNVLISLEFWDNVHPLLKEIPLKEKYLVQYGVIYNKNPKKDAEKFIDLIKKNRSI